jgi:hypothetical protein
VFVYRFTIAHEFGHVLLHGEAALEDKQQEREADQFADEFLTPRSQIVNLLPRTVNLFRLEELSRHWVSPSTCCYCGSRRSAQSLTRRSGAGYQKLNQLRSSGSEKQERVNA